MRITDRGVELVEHFEGTLPFAYNDPVGFCTFGTGHLIRRSACTSADVANFGSREHPKPGARARARRILAEDLERFARGVRPLVRRDTLDREFEAMVSLAFNIGLGQEPGPGRKGSGFAGSSVRRHHNARRPFRAGLAFLLWNKAGGRVLLGLSRRRRAERKLYRTGHWR